MSSEKSGFGDNAVASTGCSETVKLAGKEKISSKSESLQPKELPFTYHNAATMKLRDNGDLPNQNLRLQEDISDRKSPHSHSSQPSKRALDARTERKQLPSGSDTFNVDSQFVTSCVHSSAPSTPVLSSLPHGIPAPSSPMLSSLPRGATLSPAPSTPVLSSLSAAQLPVTSKPAEELYDGATVCNEFSSPGTVSTFMPTPCNSPSEGSVSLGLSPSPGILQPQAFTNRQLLTALEMSPVGGPHTIVCNGAAIINELLDDDSSVSSSVSTAAEEFLDEPPSPKRKFLPFDGSCEVETSTLDGRTTGTLPRSDIDVLFEL